MRTLTDGQRKIWETGYATCGMSVEVRDGDGEWRNLADNYRASVPWVKAIDWGDDVDKDTRTLSIRLVKQTFDNSIAPGVTSYQNESTSGEPLLALNRGVRVKVWYVVPSLGIDSTADADKLEILKGRISAIEQGEDEIRVDCQDLGGKLQDRWVEASTAYGDDGGAKEVEDVILDLLDDFGPGSMATGTTTNFTYANAGASGFSEVSRGAGDFVTEGFLADTDLRIVGSALNNGVQQIQKVEALKLTLYGTPLVNEGPVASTVQGGVVLFSETGTSTNPFQVADSPGWAIKAWQQDKASVMGIIATLADQLGWICRYKWNATIDVPGFVLTLYEPDRAAAVTVDTIPVALVRKLDKVRTQLANIRNVVEVVYFERSTTLGGTIVRQSVTRPAAPAADPSVIKYGRRWMQITEGESSQITTAAEADQMADAVHADLSTPEAEVAGTLALSMHYDPGDYLTFPAGQGEDFDSAQDLAAVSVKHAITEKGAMTTLALRGKPAGRLRVWMTKVPFPRTGVVQTHDLGPTPTTAVATPHGGAVVVSTDYPVQRGFLEFEYHMSTTPAFAPSAATLVYRGRARARTFTKLHPEDTYYFKVIAVDKHLNRGTATAQVTASPLYLQPGIIDPKIRWPGGGLLGGSFDRWTLPHTALTTPPDGWNMVTGDWITDADDSNTTITGNSALDLLSTAVATKLRSTSYTPVIVGEFYRVVVPAYASSIAAGRTFTLKVEWYTRALGLISTTTVYSAVLAAAATWENIAGVVQAPATATYARVTVEKAAQLFSLIVDRVDWGEGHPAFHAVLTGSQTLTSDTAFQKILIATETGSGNYDHGNVFDASGNKRFDAPTDGRYRFMARTLIDADYYAQMALYKNGFLFAGQGESLNHNASAILDGTDSNRYITVEATLLLASGDYIEVYARGADSAGAGKALVSGGTAFSGERLEIF